MNKYITSFHKYDISNKGETHQFARNFQAIKPLDLHPTIDISINLFNNKNATCVEIETSYKHMYLKRNKPLINVQLTSSRPHST